MFWLVCDFDRGFYGSLNYYKKNKIQNIVYFPWIIFRFCFIRFFAEHCNVMHIFFEGPSDLGSLFSEVIFLEYEFTEH